MSGFVVLLQQSNCCTIPHIILNMSKEQLIDNYADVDEVGDRLHIHPESVRRLIRRGKLPAIKFGNKWLVDRVFLEQFASAYDPRPGNKATLL